MVSSVAIAGPDKLLAEVTLQTKLTHSEVLMPHVQQVLAMTNIKKTELDAIAVSVGPGSFTGLRIGLAAAKSMAYALGHSTCRRFDAGSDGLALSGAGDLYAVCA